MAEPWGKAWHKWQAEMTQEDAMRESVEITWKCTETAHVFETLSLACQCGERLRERPAPLPAPVAAVEAALRASINRHDVGPWLADLIVPDLHATVARLLADAKAEGAREIADWYRETFCPAHGVAADEAHARGDCAACNIAAAIRARATR